VYTLLSSFISFGVEGNSYRKIVASLSLKGEGIQG